MNTEKEYVTQEKHDEITKELEHLKHDRRKEVAEHLEHAKSLGDLSENAEYHEARDEQAALEDRINHLELIIKSAEIVSGHDSSLVTVGSEVKVEKQDSKEIVTYQIVGSEEADMAQNKVSNRSPFGEAALGKKKNEIFSFSSPVGTISYKVVSIK